MMHLREQASQNHTSVDEPDLVSVSTTTGHVYRYK